MAIGSVKINTLSYTVYLTEFKWIATPSPNCVGNRGWHRTRKPLAYRVSCYTHSPHLNIPISFKIVIYLILEYIINFIQVALSHSPGSLFHLFIDKKKTYMFSDMKFYNRLNIFLFRCVKIIIVLVVFAILPTSATCCLQYDHLQAPFNITNSEIHK